MQVPGVPCWGELGEILTTDVSKYSRPWPWAQARACAVSTVLLSPRSALFPTSTTAREKQARDRQFAGAPGGTMAGRRGGWLSGRGRKGRREAARVGRGAHSRAGGWAPHVPHLLVSPSRATCLGALALNPNMWCKLQKGSLILMWRLGWESGLPGRLCGAPGCIRGG